MNRISPNYEMPILEGINSKGWNAYKSTNSTRMGRDAIIRSGPASELETDERYVMLPKAEDPRDPIQVMAALESLAIKLQRQTPTIKIRGERFEWTGFIPRESEVKVNTTLGHEISYQDFIQALTSIVQVN